MSKRDPRVDKYIAKAPDFAKPILTYVRDVVHEAVPEVEEDLKWNVPAFMYKGMMCGMAAFKHHAIFGFWKGELVLGKDHESSMGMGNYGKLTQVSDLPPKKTLRALVKKAKAVNDAGLKAPRMTRAPKPPVKTPKDLAAALTKNAKAKKVYDAFSPSAKREYVEWITDAKSGETRAKRLTTAVGWIAEGKQRNWKYM